MAKKKSSTFTLSGSVNIPSYNTYPLIILAGNDDLTGILQIKSANQEILRITKDGEIFYNDSGVMKKADCSEDVGHAFIQTVLQVTTKDYETAILDWYTRKIMEKENSDQFLNKLERVIRKRKIENLKKI